MVVALARLRSYRTLAEEVYRFVEVEPHQSQPSNSEGPSIIGFRYGSILDSNKTPTPSLIVPFEDGLPPCLPRRTYGMQVRQGWTERARVIGEARESKVTLANVRQAIANGPCIRHCLEPVGEGDVLSLRYRAWGSSKYSKRGTWVVQALRDCMEEPTVEGG